MTQGNLTTARCHKSTCEVGHRANCVWCNLSAMKPHQATSIDRLCGGSPYNFWTSINQHWWGQVRRMDPHDWWLNHIKGSPSRMCANIPRGTTTKIHHCLILPQNKWWGWIWGPDHWPPNHPRNGIWMTSHQVWLLISHPSNYGGVCCQERQNAIIPGSSKRATQKIPTPYCLPCSERRKHGCQCLGKRIFS